MNINLFNEDAYKGIKSISSNSVDLILIDPPYDIKGLHDCSFDGRSLQNFKKISDKNLDKGFDLSILNEFLRVMKHINIYIWCNKAMIYNLLTYFSNYECNFELFVWCKSNPIPMCNNHFLSDKEYCLYFYDKKVKLNNKYDTSKTYYLTPINQADADDYGHPTIKPLFIIENFIKNSSNKGDCVLDAFVGSGTTALACKHLERNFIGFEIDEEFYKIALNRLGGFNRKGEMNLFDYE